MEEQFVFPELPSLEEFRAEMAGAKDAKAKSAIVAKYAAVGQAFKDAYPEGAKFKATVEEISIPSDVAKQNVCYLILENVPQALKSLLPKGVVRHSSKLVSRMCANVPVGTLASYAGLYGQLGKVTLEVVFVNAGDKYTTSDGTEEAYEKPNFLVTPAKIVMTERIVARVEKALETSMTNAFTNPTSATPARRATAGDIEA